MDNNFHNGIRGFLELQRLLGAELDFFFGLVFVSKTKKRLRGLETRFFEIPYALQIITTHNSTFSLTFSSSDFD